MPPVAHRILDGEELFRIAINEVDLTVLNIHVEPVPIRKMSGKVKEKVAIRCPIAIEGKLPSVVVIDQCAQMARPVGPQLQC